MEQNMPFAIVWLAFGTFASGMGSFLIAGLLPEIANDLNVTVPTAGYLVTSFSATYALAAPVMAVATSPLPRRSLMLSSMGAFVMANLAAAVAPSYGLLLAMRLTLALIACLIFPGAAALASALVSAEKRGRALAIVVAGVTVAAALGVPFGTMLGQAFGWRISFVVVAMVAVLAWIGIFIGVPAVANPPPVSLRERLAPMGQTPVRVALLTTVAWAASLHTIYTYVAPYLGSFGIAGRYLAIALAMFGIGGFIGSFLGGWAADRQGSPGVLAVTLMGLATASAAFSIAPSLPHAALVAFALFAPWAVIGWAFLPPRQSQLVALAPISTTILLALNQSAIHLGAAIGSVVGAFTLIHANPAELGVAAASLAIIALALLIAELKSLPRLSPQVSL
jgi:predicted MFS family arabinose efflux permease